MKAIEITATGGADVLVLHDLPEPVAGPGQALVRVEAAGVNFIDVYVREGRYPAQLPLVPGQEAAGTVVAVGAAGDDGQGRGSSGLVQRAGNLCRVRDCSC
jgi:NADPH:quinone reductase